MLHEVRGHVVVGKQVLDKALAVVVAERLQQQPRRAAAEAGPDLEQVPARERHDQDRNAIDGLSQMLDQVEEDRLGPLDVLEDDDRRVLDGGRREQLTHGPEGPRRVGGGLRPPQRARDALDNSGCLIAVLQQAQEPGLDVVAALAGGVVDQCGDDLAQRPERESLAVGQAAADGNDGALPHRFGELVGEPRLADAGGTDDRDQLTAAPFECTSKRGVEVLQLVLTADEGRGELPAGGIGGDVDVDEPEGWYALRLALELERRERFHGHRVPDELERLLADEDLAGRRRLLETGCHVDGVAADEAMATRAMAGDHLPGVHAGTRLEGDPEVAVELLVELGERAAQAGRCPHRTQRVVLANGRHPEQGHDRIADELLDGSLVALDHGAHRAQVLPEHAAERLGVEPLRERGRVAQIAEDDRHDLADADGRGSSRKRAPAVRAEPGLFRRVHAAARALAHDASLRPPATAREAWHRRVRAVRRRSASTPI